MLADSCFSDMIEIGKGNRNINEEVFIVGGYDHGNESWKKYEAEIVVNEGMLPITMIRSCRPSNCLLFFLHQA